MKKSLTAVLVAAVLGAMTALGGPASAGSTQPLPVSYSRGQVTISSSNVKLGDLFTNAGPGAGAVIDQAPPPGAETVYDVYRLAAIARAHGLVWKAQSWSERVVVKRPGRLIDAEEIRAAIIAALETEGLKGKYEVVPSRGLTPVHIPLDTAAVPRVVNLEVRQRTGHFSAILATAPGRADSQRLTVSGRIFKLVEVPTINRRLKSGDIIRPNDIEWVSRRANLVGRNVITDADELIAMTPRRGIAAGRMVRTGEVRKPRMVKKGSIVTMVVTTPNMVLTSKGRAMEHGTRGDTIKIKNLKSKTVVEAEVTGPNAVRIVTASGLPLTSTARR